MNGLLKLKKGPLPHLFFSQQEECLNSGFKEDFAPRRSLQKSFCYHHLPLTMGLKKLSLYSSDSHKFREHSKPQFKKYKNATFNSKYITSSIVSGLNKKKSYFLLLNLRGAQGIHILKLLGVKITINRSETNQV